MGWHERHASLRWGSRGISRPEALNLEAWNFMLRDTNLISLLCLRCRAFALLRQSWLPLLSMPWAYSFALLCFVAFGFGLALALLCCL
jgi:hypothetical protein